MMRQMVILAQGQQLGTAQGETYLVLPVALKVGSQRVAAELGRTGALQSAACVGAGVSTPFAEEQGQCQCQSVGWLVVSAVAPDVDSSTDASQAGAMLCDTIRDTQPHADNLGMPKHA